MFNPIGKHTPVTSFSLLRLWMITAALIVLLMSVIEAGHAHGVINLVDDNCILCQHSTVHDALIQVAKNLAVPVLCVLLFNPLYISFIALRPLSFTSIRGPPSQHQIR